MRWTIQQVEVGKRSPTKEGCENVGSIFTSVPVDLLKKFLQCVPRGFVPVWNEANHRHFPSRWQIIWFQSVDQSLFCHGCASQLRASLPPSTLHQSDRCLVPQHTCSSKCGLDWNWRTEEAKSFVFFFIIMQQTWIVTLNINTAILHFHFHWNHAWTTCQLVKALVKLVSLVTRFKSGLVISILSASRKSPFLQVLSWVELRIMDRI